MNIDATTTVKPTYTCLLMAIRALASNDEDEKQDALYALEREIKFIEENFPGVKA